MKSFLAALAKPAKKPTETTPNEFTKGKGTQQGGVTRFLQQLKVARHPEPFGNDDAFSAKDVKVFDRQKNNYGHPYSKANDWNQGGSPLQNPVLNVRTEDRYQALDSIGQGFRHQYKVADLLTSEWVTPQMMNKEDAQRIAANLNLSAELNQLDKSVTRKHFQQVANTVRAIEHPVTRQEFADHHAGIFAKQNPRFDHSKWHAACGTKTKAERGVTSNEDRSLPSTPITEGLLTPLKTSQVDAVERALKRNNYTMGGSIAQTGTTTTSTAIADLKAVQRLKNEQQRSDEPNEMDAVNAKSSPRRNTNYAGSLGDDGKSAAQFLNELNQRALISEPKK